MNDNYGIQIEKLTAENAALKEQLAEANHWRERHSADADAYGKQAQSNWQKCELLKEQLAFQQQRGTEFRDKFEEAKRANAQLRKALEWVNGPKHEGPCVFTDKADEGCHLCRDAENKNWHLVTDAISSTSNHGYVAVERLDPLIPFLESVCGWCAGDGSEFDDAEAVGALDLAKALRGDRK